MDLYGPGERELLEKSAMKLYEEAVMHGELALNDARWADDGELRPAIDLLLRLGLIMRDVGVSAFVPIDPTTVSSNVVAPLSKQGSELLSESAEWARVFGSLALTYRRSPQAAKGPFREVHGDAIEPFLNSLLADAQEELLTAQPTFGRSREALDSAQVRDIAALDRGVTMRTLYQHSVRKSPMTRSYVEEITRRGAEVRTLDEFFMRMIVVDRRVAIIPGATLAIAFAIMETAIVEYLADVFERHWERGRAFTDRDTHTARDIDAEQRAMTIRMLIGGHSDSVSAKRLGVSPRSYAILVAGLKDEFEVASRFQLGYELGLRGISGSESPDEDPPAGGD